MNWSKANAVFLSSLLLVSGCGKSSSTSTQGKSTSLITAFVKGDPLTVISGSTSNNQSIISLDEMNNFDDYSLSSINQFTQQDQVVEKKDTETAESGNEAPEADRTEMPKSQLFSFKKVDNDYIYSSPQSKIQFIFNESAGKLSLTEIEFADVVYEVKTIHYSLKKSGDAFSILATTSDLESGNILLAFTFTKKSQPKDIKKVSKVFKYLFGEGVLVPWDQKEDLEVSLCAPRSSRLEKIYKDGIEQWRESLKGRLNLKVKTLYAYPPFSDLNNQCIYTVDNYLTIPGNKFVNMGTTFSKGDLFKGNLIDADIIIWAKENAKFGTTLENTESLQSTVAHEFGHLLGLHHQFDKNIKSIMSYEGIDWITVYDINAIANLYPYQLN